MGFDMDGVIINHVPNKIALAERYDVHLGPEEVHSEVLPGKLTPADYRALQDELYSDSELALSAPLMTGAFAVLREMKIRNVPFVLISRRREPMIATELLRRRDLWGDIFTEQNSFFVGTPEEKNVASVREGVTHFFDDERKVLRAIPDVGHRFLFDSCHQFKDETEFERIFDWQMLRGVIFEK